MRNLKVWLSAAACLLTCGLSAAAEKPGVSLPPGEEVCRVGPGRLPLRIATPPPPGEEASYEWYRRQYTDPSVFAPIGPPADPAETLVSPGGQLLMFLNGRVFPTTALIFGLCEGTHAVPMGTGSAARQSLEDGYLPIVVTEWNRGDIKIRETAFAEPLQGSSYESGLESTLAWAVFELINAGKEPCDVTFFAAQPVAGKKPQTELIWRDGVVLENGSARWSARVPSGFAAEFQRAWSEDGNARSGPNPSGFVKAGGLSNALLVRGRIEGVGSARVVFNRVVDFPGAMYWTSRPATVSADELTSPSADEAHQRARSTWKSLSEGVSRFNTPDDFLDRIAAKAMLDGYFLTKRWNGQYIVFDAVNYRCQWDSSSTNWFYALDLMGDHRTAARLLDTVLTRQGERKPAGTRTREGCFSDVTNILRDGSAASWASCNGWALWAMAQHARLVNDRSWLSAHRKKILDGCEWIIRERQFSKEQPDNPCRGLVFGKFVCDMPDQGGVGGVGYFTYTDAINYMGLHLMGQLLSEWGDAEGQRLVDEAELYRRDIVAAVERLTDRSRDPWYVPWALHAPKHEDVYLNGVCGPINLAYGGVLGRDDPLIGHVVRWNIDHTHQGSLETSATANMFYSQDLAVVLLEQGRVEEFLRMFYAILAANVSHQTLTTCEWRSNTQPHVHSIAGLIRMVRTMLVQERDGRLYLLQGVPRRWLEQGKEIKIARLPTWYGDISVHCISNVGSSRNVRVRLEIPDRLGAVPLRLRLRLPGGLRLAGVTVNGKTRGGIDGEWVVLAGLKGSVDVVARTEGSIERP